MANKRSWWKLTLVDEPGDMPVLELTDVDLGHIAESIKQGFTEGEIVADEVET
jgi:hypothetical protein